MGRLEGGVSGRSCPFLLCHLHYFHDLGLDHSVLGRVSCVEGVLLPKVLCFHHSPQDKEIGEIQVFQPKWSYRQMVLAECMSLTPSTKTKPWLLVVVASNLLTNSLKLGPNRASSLDALSVRGWDVNTTEL